MNLRTLLLAFAAASIAASQAQSPVTEAKNALKENHQVIATDGALSNDEKADIISVFYEDQFQHAQDPKAPYFLFMSRNNKLAMGIGGQIEGIASYDWHGSIPGSGFATYEIPIPLNPANINSFQTNIGHTSIFLTAFGRNAKFGAFQLYIQAKFVGDGSARLFKLKKAYATVGDWTVGLANSTFSDPASQPSTVETQGPCSEIGYNRILLRYMHKFQGNWRVALSVENPDFQIAPSTDYYYTDCSQGIPDFAAFVQYGDGDQHLRVSAIMKNMRYRNLVANKNEYVTGWGLQVSTTFRPVSPLTVMGAFQTGHGIGNLVNDLSCGNNDLLGNAAELGKMYAPRSFGWYGALQYNFSAKVFSTIMFSQERILPKENSFYGDTQYKYALYGTANVFWKITPRFTTAAEINIGEKKIMDGKHRSAYRASVMASFDF